MLIYGIVICGRTLHKIFAIILICALIGSTLQYIYFNSVIRNRIWGTGNESLSGVHSQKILPLQRLSHSLTVTSYYDKRKDWVTSNLGAMLFKNQHVKFPSKNSNRTFVVLIWKYSDWLNNRHVYGFDNMRTDPLDQCSARNCLFTGDANAMQSADAVVIHIQHGEIPLVIDRNLSQRWIFLTDESPQNSFSMASEKPNLEDWVNVFNWSMSYRSDADIPVPYGRTIPLNASLMPNTLCDTVAEYVPYWKVKQWDVLIGVLMSNCGVSERMQYLNEMQKYIEIDVHGRCSKMNKNSCPGHFKSDCEVITKYLFYLVFENSKCREYLTEKIFHNAFSKGAIPVILGPPKADCELLLPPNSFLHVDDYKSPQDLVNDIIRISRSNESLLAFHEWRDDFEIANEHGYFNSRSFHYCRVCEALNSNDEQSKSYALKDLKLFLDPNWLCSH